jgi:hypothetical protein
MVRGRGGEGVQKARAIFTISVTKRRVANREHVHGWPDGETADDFVLLDSLDPLVKGSARVALVAACQRLRSDSRFQTVVDEAGVLLVERRRSADR